MFKLLVSALGVAALTSCGAHPQKIADHTLYADDEATLTSDGPVRFAVVGNLRDPIPLVDGKRGETEGVTEALVSHLRKKVDDQELDFVTLMGDTVRMSSDKEWGSFDKRWQELLDGSTVPTTEGYRIPVMPVAGDRDFFTDKQLKGFGGAFPDVGVDIGYNRVASWYAFDIRVEDTIWRMLVLDSNKAKLGSRWNEQMYWLPRGTEGRYDNLLLFMHHPVLTLGEGVERNAGGAPKELMDAIEDNTQLMKTKAVFTANTHSSEAFLPHGRLGEAHITAGGGGAPADTLERWGKATDLGYGDIQLEPLFDLGLQKRFDDAAGTNAFPEVVIDRAKGAGSYEGFTAAYDPEYFPLYGYWLVEIQGETLTATWMAYLPGGDFEAAYALTLNEGWRAKSL